MANYLDNDIKFVAGVGEARARLLEKELGIRTLGDMLCHYPFRYIDRTRIYRIDQIAEGDSALIQFRGRITGVSYAGAGRKRRFTAVVNDGSGVAELVWFQGIKWIEKRIEVGREYLIFGRPSFFKGELSVVHPEIETIEKAFSRKAESGLQGIYSSTERLSSVLGTKGIYTIVCNLWPMVRDHIRETLPDRMRTRYGLLSLRDALYNIHFPQSPELLRQAQYRLKFEELLGIQLGIQSRRTARLSKNNGFLFPKVGGVFNTFFNTRLPFPLTGAQKRVVKEIRQDTISGYQMNRLLQGDVGSGKTLVALMSMLLAVDNGFQACMMAPTEILARQHYATFQRMLEGMDVRVAILTGASKARERREALAGIADGSIDLLIGTHALIEDRVQFSNLGFVVIDEQHRFGVEQRARLWTKNEQPPHILVMTATPIPRTLAMTLYGDLDVSVIDELPPGRQPIRTVHYTDAARLRLFGFMRQEIKKGRQIYVVYPLIKESETMDYKDLQDGYEAISRDFPLPEYVTTICHGKMKPEEGGVDASVQERRGEYHGRHFGHRGRRRCSQCYGHGDRVGRTIRPLAASPVARPRWTGQPAVLLYPHVGREALEGGPPAARSDVRNQRRIPPGGAGPQAAGCGRRERYAPERHGLRPEDRQPDARQPDPDRHPGSGRRSADGRPDTDPKRPRGASGTPQALLRP